MTSSGSSSSKALALGLFAAAVLGGCRGARPAAVTAPAPLLVLYPVLNLNGGPAPSKELTAALRATLEKQGLPLVPDIAVMKALASRRLRYTGAVDREAATVLREQTGATGIIVPTLELYSALPPYRFALTMRLVTTDPEPEIRWLDAYAGTGKDHPGLLGAGILGSMERVRDRAFEQLAASLAASLRAPVPRAPCGDGGAIRPSRSYSAPFLSDAARRTVAVLPFVNDTQRRDAGEIAALRFLGPLIASGTVRVLEPGVVRQELLTYRFGATGGIGLDDARALLELLSADLVLSGTVRTFADASGTTGAPSVALGVYVLDRQTAELAWSSTSNATGEDGVYFFGVGRVSTASALTCRMARGVVDAMLGDRPKLPDSGPLPAKPARGTMARAANEIP
ncbi:hypothetical protein [Anaeromyxobacter paludicola]|uniref:Lipoprotein n=1 Tax=Anaeromyxobacter paludicola TaxID=2918171 RepID=A0ABM7XBL9_9BACT|nr:hypothetical protein [Anaeromyxobacter paludicola]BDG09221.1 lipoprotein [Anaeromyxobacter paludicola]